MNQTEVQETFTTTVHHKHAVGTVLIGPVTGIWYTVERIVLVGGKATYFTNQGAMNIHETDTNPQWRVWSPVVPLPDSWYAVKRNGICSGIKFSTAEKALAYDRALIAAVRLSTDENGEDGFEIVRAS